MLARTSHGNVGLPGDGDAEGPLSEEARALKEELEGGVGGPVLPRLDADTLVALGINSVVGQEQVSIVGEALGRLLSSGNGVEILGFGRFVVRAYRSIAPPELNDTAFVEAPAAAPIDFIPAAPLQRQLDSATLDASIVPRCDVLFAFLRDEPRIARGRVPVLIKGVFRAVADALILHHRVTLPGLGSFRAPARPTLLQVIPGEGTVKPLPARRAILFRPLLKVVDAIPNLYRPQPAPGRVVTPAPPSGAERYDDGEDL